MPQFNDTPRHISDIRREIKMSKFNQSNPIGIISESLNFAYGFDGDKYYVTEGAFYHLVSKAVLFFDEAKNLYNALVWNNENAPEPKVITKLVKEYRKLKLSGDNGFWFFVDNLN